MAENFLGMLCRLQDIQSMYTYPSHAVPPKYVLGCYEAAPMAERCPRGSEKRW